MAKSRFPEILGAPPAARRDKHQNQSGLPRPWCPSFAKHAKLSTTNLDRCSLVTSVCARRRRHYERRLQNIPPERITNQHATSTTNSTIRCLPDTQLSESRSLKWSDTKRSGCPKGIALPGILEKSITKAYGTVCLRTPPAQPIRLEQPAYRTYPD